MVAEQRETVQRIDENVLDIESNITSAHGELSKYLAGMMSNRWLMLKMFGVLIVFVSLLSFYVPNVNLIYFLAVLGLHPGFMIIASTFQCPTFACLFLFRNPCSVFLSLLNYGP